VSVAGGLLAIMMQSFRNENHKDHAETITELRWLRKIVERVELKQDNHVIDFHVGGRSGKPKKKGAQREPEEISDSTNN
jgi:hypothetical protein